MAGFASKMIVTCALATLAGCAATQSGDDETAMAAALFGDSPMSATDGEHFYATPEEAIDHIVDLLHDSSIHDPSLVTFYARVGTADLLLPGWQHSELVIDIGYGPGGQHVSINMRTVGDPNGAGVFDGRSSVGIDRGLCLTWESLQRAIRASYRPGRYGTDFVCHNITSYVLRAIGVSPEYFAPRIGGWNLSMTLFGPTAPSGLPVVPDAWEPSLVCTAFFSTDPRTETMKTWLRSMLVTATLLAALPAFAWGGPFTGAYTKSELAFRSARSDFRKILRANPQLQTNHLRNIAKAAWAGHGLTTARTETVRVGVARGIIGRTEAMTMESAELIKPLSTPQN